MAHMKNNNFYTTKEVLKKIGITRPTLYRWLREGKISEVMRNRNNFRLFTDKDIANILAYKYFIKKPEPNNFNNRQIISPRGGNIAEHTKTKTMLKELKEKYPGLYNSVKDGIIMTDIEGHILECNNTFLKMLGYSHSKIMKMTYQQLTPIKWHKIDIRVVKYQVLERGYSDEFEKEYIKKDGTILPATVRAWLIRNKQGKPKGMWGIIRDLTEHKQAEEQIKLLSNAVNGAIDAIAITDKKGIITYVNPSMEKLYGYDKGRLIGRSIAILHPNPKVVKKIILKLMKTGSWNGETLQQKKDKKTFSVILSLSVVRDEKGNPIATMGAIRDITERKNQEEKIKQAKEYAELLYLVSPSAIFTVDTNRRITTWNKKAEEVTGFSAEEIIGKECLIFAEEPCKDKCGLYSNGVKKPINAKECKILRKDGQVCFISKNVDLLKDKKGNIIGGIETFIDITERKKAEKRLKQYQFMVESAHDVIFFKDLESRYIIANKKTLEVFGLSNEQLIGKNDYQILPDKKEARKNIENDQLVFKTGKSTEITKRVTGRGGKEYWFQAIKAPQFDDKGNIVGLIGIARDITEQKRIEKVLQELEKTVA